MLFDRVVEEHKKFEVYIARSSVVSQVQHGIHVQGVLRSRKRENTFSFFFTFLLQFFFSRIVNRYLGIKKFLSYKNVNIRRPRKYSIFIYFEEYN